VSKKIEILKAQIAETKAELGTKLTQLEDQVRHDASNAKQSLDGAVDNVKTAVENVRNVAKAFSITHQIEQRPLLLTGGAMVTGFVFVRWLSGPSRRERLAYAAESRSLSSSIAGGAVRSLKSMAVSFLIDLALSKLKEKIETR